MIGVQVAVNGAHLAPSTRSRGTEPSSTMATEAPSWRAEAATSAPIQPAPMTTTRFERDHGLAQLIGVGDAAKVAHPGEVGTRHGDAAR